MYLHVTAAAHSTADLIGRSLGQRQSIVLSRANNKGPDYFLYRASTPVSKGGSLEMSQKITSKNLSYDNSLPPFLAALRAQTAGGDDARKPSIGNRQLGKKRSASEEAEDGPVVVDEDGNVMSVEIGQDGTVKEVDEKEADGDVKAEASAKKEGEGTKTSTKGGRKRKVGKVIGEAAAQADETQGKKDQKQTKEEHDDPPKEKKPKKKVKKIKLSFDEEEDG